MFKLTANISEKDLGPVIKFLNSTINAHDVNISYIPRETSKSYSSNRNIMRTKQLTRGSTRNSLGKLDTLVLAHFKDNPTKTLELEEIGRFVEQLGYKATSASPTLSVLVSTGCLIRKSQGFYQYKLISKDVVEVIDNVTKENYNTDSDQKMFNPSGY